MRYHINILSQQTYTLHVFKCRRISNLGSCMNVHRMSIQLAYIMWSGTPLCPDIMHSDMQLLMIRNAFFQREGTGYTYHLHPKLSTTFHWQFQVESIRACMVVWIFESIHYIVFMIYTHMSWV